MEEGRRGGEEEERGSGRGEEGRRGGVIRGVVNQLRSVVMEEWRSGEVM